MHMSASPDVWGAPCGQREPLFYSLFVASSP
jgi:hypothetical protein